MTTKKVVTFIKQYFFMLALAATFVGFSAFKYAERFDTPDDGWYEVTLINPSLPNPDIPSNQQIGASISTPPPVSDTTVCAQTGNDGHMCAIELSFDTSDEDNQPEKPETVQDAQQDALVNIDAQARQPEDDDQ